jgi:hypothetical protein
MNVREKQPLKKSLPLAQLIINLQNEMEENSKEKSCPNIEKPN